jgi:ketosteroid isomerase-like protein
VVGNAAYELGTEHVGATLAGRHVRTQIRMTNIYWREGGTGWIVHHHADQALEMQSGP